MELLQSVTPIKVKDENLQDSFSSKYTFKQIPHHEKGNNFLPKVRFGNLSEDQKTDLIYMIQQESESFAANSSDIVSGLEVEINLDDKRPVQKNYIAVPRALYGEVKTYIEDLLNKQFI